MERCEWLNEREQKTGTTKIPATPTSTDFPTSREQNKNAIHNTRHIINTHIIFTQWILSVNTERSMVFVFIFVVCCVVSILHRETSSAATCNSIFIIRCLFCVVQISSFHSFSFCFCFCFPNFVAQLPLHFYTTYNFVRFVSLIITPIFTGSAKFKNEMQFFSMAWTCQWLNVFWFRKPTDGKFIFTKQSLVIN